MMMDLRTAKLLHSMKKWTVVAANTVMDTMMDFMQAVDQ